MTKEELNKLKKGDEVFVKTVFEGLAKDGDAYVRFFWTNWKGKRVPGTMSVTSDAVLLRSDPQQPVEKSKYDPCRPFREGDIVTPIERDGREVPDGAPVGEKCTVVEPEKNGIVRIYNVSGTELYIHEIPFYHLELVTPVDELEPFYIDQIQLEMNQNQYCFAIKTREHKHLIRLFYTSDFETMEQTKAAAEEECARLNAEYRKEQK